MLNFVLQFRLLSPKVFSQLNIVCRESSMDRWLLFWMHVEIVYKKKKKKKKILQNLYNLHRSQLVCIEDLALNNLWGFCSDTGGSLKDLLGVMDNRNGWRERVREIRASSATRCRYLLDNDDSFGWEIAVRMIPWKSQCCSCRIWHTVNF